MIIYFRHIACFHRLFIMLVIAATIFSGCAKELDIHIPEPESKIVIEGWIEQGKPARVLLTRSIPFFSDLDSLSLMEIPITHARVSVITETDYEILTLIPNVSFFPPYVYNSTEINGSVKNRYRLEVEYQGQKLTATTTIPEPACLDSIWFMQEPGYDSLGRIWIQFSDNPLTIDFYRIMTQTAGKDKRYIPTRDISTFSDRYFSGETIKFGLLRGLGSILELGENQLFRIGDTVNIKFCTMDREHYEFWNSVQAMVISSSNPYAASFETIESNITGGYGIWGGYGATYYTFIVE
ncbi:MAG: DUF4249 family protein [Bacteroidales bacterium]|nr:DUF4249 family protein [Bacteroidales bacterium]MBN2764713.1 DUF4249 family protein [Bacteroidales bacterium]